MSETILILGMGKTGRATAEFFQLRSCKVIKYDDNFDDFKMDIDEINFDEISFIVQSPGFPNDHSICKKANDLGITIFSDIDVFMRAVSGSKLIGVTGTNGKSTTTALIFHILKSRFDEVIIGGNIGTPVLSLPIKNNAIYVLELSSYQLEISKKLDLDVAVLTNISEDHLDHHGNMENYINAKKKIFDGAKYSISSCDDEYSKSICDELESTHDIKEIFLDNNDLLKSELRKITNLPGDHNLQNVAIAVEASRWFGLSEFEINAAISSFNGLEHRIEEFAKIDGVSFINDSKATNAESLIKAILSFPDAEIFLILGGKAKRDGLIPALPYLNNVKQFYLIGDASERFANELKKDNVNFSDTLENATKKAFIGAKSLNSKNKKIVMLSPACASFDQFKNFEDRGNKFKEIVAELENESL